MLVDNPGYRVQACQWIWEHIVLPFKCKGNFVKEPIIILYIHGVTMMADLCQ